MTNLVSIIVPVYKIEEYLKRCLDSIIIQSYPNIEIILVDDGSPDNCPKICEEYAVKDQRIKVFHKKNGGLSDARNFGLEKAKGKYILFVDSDDWIEKDTVKKLVTSLETNNADIAICGIKKIQNNNIEYCDYFKEDILLSKDEALRLLLENKIITSHAWNKLYKKEIIERFPFPKGKLYEDVRIMHNVFINCNTVAICKDYLYNYYINNSSITGINKVTNKFEYIDSFIERYDEMKNTSKLYGEICYYQICLCISSVFNHYVFTNEEKKKYADKLNEYINYLKNGKKIIKKYSSKKERLFIIFTRIFKYNSAKKYLFLLQFIKKET